jgi:uncharacterized membrane protein YdjX (TVP38/TMEM64 family)
LIFSALVFIYQAELLRFIQGVEMRKDTNPVSAAALLVTVQTLTAPLGFPGTPITILTGTLFGYLLGTIIALVGNTLGGCFAFLLSRYVLQNYVQKKILPHHPKIKRYEKKMAQRGFTTVVVLRFLPLFPFNTLNFLLGTSSISFKKFALGSFVGMIPGTILFVYLGDSLRMLSVTNIILAITGIATLTFLGVLYKKKIDAA